MLVRCSTSCYILPRSHSANTRTLAEIAVDDSETNHSDKKMREYSYICGQLFFNNSFDTLENLFQDCQLDHEIRHSSHFQDGTYLRLLLNPNTELTFEKIETDEFLICGEAINQDDLIKLAGITSSIFSRQKLKHRLELYNTDDKEFAYYNYDWTR